MPQEAYVLFLVTLLGGFGVLVTWPVVRAFADRIRARGASAGNEQLQAQQDALARDLEQTRHDVAELQERVDFAERLLAKQQDPARIAPPQR